MNLRHFSELSDKDIDDLHGNQIDFLSKRADRAIDIFYSTNTGCHNSEAHRQHYGTPHVSSEVLESNRFGIYSSDYKLLTNIFKKCFDKSFNLIGEKFLDKYIFLDEKKRVCYLDLSERKIKHFPYDICFLDNLEELYLDDNFIKYIPPNISKLENLEYLELYNNRIENIPKEMMKMKNLCRLNLGENPLTESSKKTLDAMRICGDDLEIYYD